MPPSPLGNRRRRPGRRTSPRTAAMLLLGLFAVLGAGAWALTDHGPRAIGGATRADVQWRMPRSVTEERAFTLRMAGGVDGHATLRTQLRTGPLAAGCPGEPPEESSRRVLADLPDPEEHLGRGIGDSQRFEADASGAARLCGWLLSTSAAGDGTQLARFDRPISVAPAPATLEVRRRQSVRAADRFTVRVTGATAHPGRRVLILAVPVDPATESLASQTGDGTAATGTTATPAPTLTPTPILTPTTPGGTTPPTTPDPVTGSRQRAACEALRAGRRSARRPVRVEARLDAGDYLRRVKVRFPYLAVGRWQLCVQVIEADDPAPEAVETAPITVTESLACEQAKTAIGDRRDDLRLLRRRRAVLEARVTTAHRAARAASSSRQAQAARRREIANEARLKSYQVGTKAISQLIGRVTEDARQYCPDL